MLMLSEIITKEIVQDHISLLLLFSLVNPYFLHYAKPSCSYVRYKAKLIDIRSSRYKKR